MTAVREESAARSWMTEGTSLFLDTLSRTSDEALSAPSCLPGWTGRHLVAHVAANAEALHNLAHWAATGEETPMYASPQQRDRDIQAGSLRPTVELRRWAGEAAERLTATLDGLTAQQWGRPVRTAQGRSVPASEIPWLRAREVMVHAVDLDPALGFAALPEDFLVALADDIVGRRSSGDQPALLLTVDGGRHVWTVPGDGEPVEVHGSLAGVAAYLAGRGCTDVIAYSGAVPTLPPWL